MGVFISSHLLSEMELMCDRICIIDNGVVIGEKALGGAPEAEDVFRYVFMTNDNEKTYAHFKKQQYNCARENGGVQIVTKRSEIPGIVRDLVKMGLDIYAVNEKQRSLEQDFISMTTGTKTQIR